MTLEQINKLYARELKYLVDNGFRQAELLELQTDLDAYVYILKQTSRYLKNK